MKPKRIIPLLDIKNDLVIKGINLEGLRVIGNAEKIANFYFKNGADEICYLDNVATLYGTNNLSKFISKAAEKIFIPMSVGGGIKTIDDIKNLFSAGADKVCLNSALVEDINFLTKASKLFGSANITSIIQAIKIRNDYFICKSNGRDLVKINPLDWARSLEDRGSGEIILTVVNNEGLKEGFDIKITSKISKAVGIPVIAHGGAGNFKHILEILKNTNVSGVALASFLHYDAINYISKPITKIGNTNFIKNFKKKSIKKNLILDLKKYLKSNGIKIRL